MKALEGSTEHELDAGLSLGRVYRSLARDAYLQVADNLVFRIMLVVVFVMVLLTFVIGFREDHIAILFGVGRVEYDSVLGSIGGAFGVVGGSNRGATFIEGIQTLFTTTIAGTFGALFAVVATSFFVPRMLEKGAADTLFSKPVRRGVLVLSRYLGSLIFVGLLATVLVFGMWSGFAVASGYTNPEFLWSAPMLIYQFVLLSAISTFFGALTRSSIATLLLTVLAWWTSVGFHAVWLMIDYVPQVQERFDQKAEEPLTADAGGEAESAKKESHPVIAFIKSAVHVAHLVLPKTGDADALTQLVRATLHGETRTLLGGVVVRRQVLPIYERADGAILVSSPSGSGEALFPEGRGHYLEMDARRPLIVRVDEDGTIAGWTGSVRNGRRDRETEVAPTEESAPVESREGEYVLPSWAEAIETVPPSGVDLGFDDPETFYTRRFTWDQTELGYSPQYSFISSVLFSLALLLAATWRVRRIDF